MTVFPHHRSLQNSRKFGRAGRVTSAVSKKHQTSPFFPFLAEIKRKLVMKSTQSCENRVIAYTALLSDCLMPVVVMHRKRSVEARVEAAWSRSQAQLPSDEEIAAMLAKEVSLCAIYVCAACLL